MKMPDDQDNLVARLIKSMPALKRGYQRGVNRDLSQHHWEGIFARQTLSLIDNLLTETDGLLDQTKTTKDGPESFQRWPEIQQRLEEHKEELVQYALHFNRTSCALSNFPDEHTPSAEYITEVLLQVETKWQDWCKRYR